ncbi:glycosyltransferase family 2 protein [archaeon]|jgi:glycosyltransferase involved in cell wall biosynthesis|nr:glycosyltransferase family 2 protein [archaeon]MBT3730459.1 glycosyltransferase family 2 protein [archaeon]MBT4670442.1 glycosyltransferase family 2 protein [archaeon]MBT5030093.1 glycosyltransferase family 2 protein [archaeon]MBT5288216.1 glycosyltransferase family 2 protein [archaeon]
MKLSIIIPAYNEEDNILPLYKEILKNIPKKYSYEIIFIDDGSTDSTLKNIKAIKDKNIKSISFRKNFGKAEGLNTGFKEATGDIIITMDADLQDNPKEIPNFIKKINEGYDLVSGWKYNRLDPLGKRVPSKLFNKLTRILTRVNLHDFNCGFKAYKKEVAKSLKLYGEMHRYIPAMASWQGFKVGEIKVDHRERVHGVSKYGWERLIKGLLDLCTITFLGSYQRSPLHLFGTIGLAATAEGILIGTYLTIKWFEGYPLSNRPLLLLAVLLIVLGIQILSLGLIAEMINYNKYYKENGSKIKN